MIEEIHANAELVVQQFSPLKAGGFGYDEESVCWLDGYIGRLRDDGKFSTPEERRKIVGILGSYLGECIIRNFGGSWAQRDGNWCVAFDENNCAYPFANVEKRFDFGDEDSILGFYTSIPMLFSKLTVPARNRPWWRFWG